MASRKPELPVDRGWAWLIMIAVFINVLVTLAFIRSLSILLETFLLYFQAPATVVTLAFGISEAMESLSNIALPTLLLPRFSVRTLSFVGSLFHGLCILALAFAQNTVMLIVIFSVLGLTRALMLTPPLVHLGHFFKKRLSFANAFANAGLSIATLGSPLLTKFLLEEYGLQGGLLIFGALCLHSLPASLLFRPLSMYHSEKDSEKLVCVSETSEDYPVKLAEHHSAISESTTDSWSTTRTKDFRDCQIEAEEIRSRMGLQKSSSTFINDESKICSFQTSCPHRNLKERQTKSDYECTESDKYCLESTPLIPHFQQNVTTCVQPNYRKSVGTCQSYVLNCSVSTPDIPLSTTVHSLHGHSNISNSTPLLIQNLQRTSSRKPLTHHMTNITVQPDLTSLKMGDLDPHGSLRNSVSLKATEIKTSELPADENIHDHVKINQALKLRRLSQVIARPNPHFAFLEIDDTQAHAKKEHICQYQGLKQPIKKPCSNSGLSKANNIYNQAQTSQSSRCAASKSFDCKIAEVEARELNGKSNKRPNSRRSRFQWCKEYLSSSVLTKPLAIMLILAGGIGVNTQGGNTFMPVLGLENGLHPDQLPWLLTIAGIADIVGKLSIGFFADLGYLRPIWIACITQITIGIVFQFTTFYTSMSLMASMATIFGLTAGMLHVLLTPMIIEMVGLNHLAHVFAVYFLVSGLATFLMNVVVGFLKDLTGSFIGGYHFIGALMLTGAFILCLEPVLVRYEKSRNKHSVQ